MIVSSGPENGLAPQKWDVRFLQRARQVASWSKDPSTQVGAVLVDPSGKIAVSEGFNGFAQNMSDDPALYVDRSVKYSRILHSEMNALIFARRDLRDCTSYTWPFGPCDRCVVALLQAGIRRFVFPKCPDDKKDRWESLDVAKRYIEEASKLAVHPIAWVELPAGAVDLDVSGR